MLWEAWPAVAAEEGTLAEALKGNWGGEAVRRIVASAPEVSCVLVRTGEDDLRQ